MNILFYLNYILTLNKIEAPITNENIHIPIVPDSNSTFLPDLSIIAMQTNVIIS